MKNKLVACMSVILALAFIIGVTAAAAGTSGSTDDPLISLSYLTDVFGPKIMGDLQAEIKTAGAALEKTFSDKIAEASKQAGTDGSMTLVTLTSGQKLTASVGAEIMLRVGTANCLAANTPGLIDTTTGGSINSGAALTANHVYMVTIEGHGITATAATVKVLISGKYTIT